MSAAWLTIRRGTAPLLLSLPHTGTELCGLEPRIASPWLARKDTDWWIDQLYAFALNLDATIVKTAISRTVIDVNRDPSGLSLYPGRATTELCPTTTFDGEALYLAGGGPSEVEIAARRAEYFDPYHATLEAEITHLRAQHPKIILYDCHSIRSVIPRLFDGVLPVFNLGTNAGASADLQLATRVEALMAASGQSHVTNGRFKGGYITRRYGRPEAGVHALQMELACRAYMADPSGDIGPHNWPMPFEAKFAEPVRATLEAILSTAMNWALI